MPALRIDWQRVRTMSDDPSELSLFVLPTAYRTMLLHMTKILEWEATFRVDDYDFADWDLLQAIVAQGDSGLMANETLADVIEAINNISLVVNNDVDVSAGGGGCCGADAWNLPPDWRDGWPDELPPDSELPTSETEATLCDMAHSTHHELKLYFATFRDAVGNQNPYQDLVEDLDNFALGAGSAGWLYTAITVVATTFWDGFDEQLDDYWDSILDDYVCSMSTQFNNANDFKAWLLNRVYDDNIWEMGFYLETLLTGTSFDSVYDGTYQVFPEFIGSTCSCVEPPLPAPTNYVFVPAVFDSPSNTGTYWQNITFATDGNLLTATYLKVGPAGGDNSMLINQTASILDAGYDLGQNPIQGIYLATDDSFPDNDKWRTLLLGGSSYNWSPRFPFAGQGKQAFIYDGLIENDPNIIQFSSDVFGDNGGAVKANFLDASRVKVNANHDDPSTPLKVYVWLMLSDSV